jgi:hypothetical protein
MHRWARMECKQTRKRRETRKRKRGEAYRALPGSMKGGASEIRATEHHENQNKGDCDRFTKTLPLPSTSRALPCEPVPRPPWPRARHLCAVLHQKSKRPSKQKENGQTNHIQCWTTALADPRQTHAQASIPARLRDKARGKGTQRNKV